MWARAVNTALGLWLMAAPQILYYHGAARNNDHIIGPIVVSCAVMAMWEVLRPVRWINLVLGAWLLLSPWLLGFPLIPTINSSLVGLLIGMCALVRGERTHAFCGRWSSLWRTGELMQYPDPDAPRPLPH